MLEFGACGRCKQEISPERKQLSPLVCNHCGFTGSKADKAMEKKMQSRILLTYFGLAALIVGTFMQVVNWGNHSLEIIPLTAKELIGSATVQDYQRLINICMDVKKYDCVENADAKIAARNPSALADLGKFQMRRAEYSQAAQSFYQFFQNGGQDLEASYNYAQALSQLGRVDDASKYFQQVLKARPDVLQVTVVQNFVKMLMGHQRYAEARQILESIRAEGPSSNMFMESEYQKLKQLTTTSRT